MACNRATKSGFAAEAQRKDVTFFTRKEILRVFKKFRETSPDIVPKRMTGNESMTVKVPVEFMEKLPELKENPFRRRICEVFSRDGKGHLTFEDLLDLLSAFCEQAPRDIKVFYAFKIYDFDGDRYIGIPDLEQAVRLLTRNELSVEEISQIAEKVIEEADVDGDGHGALFYRGFEHPELEVPLTRITKKNEFLQPAAIQATRNPNISYFFAGIRPLFAKFVKKLETLINSKYSEELAQECLEWIRLITDEPIDVSGDMDNFYEILKDGTLLCRLVNCLKPGSVSKINKTTMAFKCMENISSFLNAAAVMGVPAQETFQTVDLWERQNLNSVVTCLQSLGRKAHKFGQPSIGPKEADKNVREFSDEQLKAGNTVISLQYGSNKGANQSGINFGNTRHM